jgi:hypothetical protein
LVESGAIVPENRRYKRKENEKNISAEPNQKSKNPRIPYAYGHESGQKNHQSKASQRAKKTGTLGGTDSEHTYALRDDDQTVD